MTGPESVHTESVTCVSGMNRYGSSALMGDAGTPVFIKLILRRSFNGDNTDVPRRTDTRHI
jgi:hypothetical protein